MEGELMTSRELKSLADRLHKDLCAAGIKTIGTLQLRDFGEIPEVDAQKVFFYWIRQGWKRSPDDSALLVVPGVKPSKPMPSKPPSISSLRKATLQRVGDILNDADANPAVLAAAIRFMQSEPLTESEVKAWIKRDRGYTFKAWEKVIAAEFNLSARRVKEIADKVREELPRAGKGITRAIRGDHPGGDSPADGDDSL